MSVTSGIADVLKGFEKLRVSEGWPDTINTDAAIVDGPLTYDDNDLEGRDVNQVYEITLLFSLSAGLSRARDRLMEYLEKKGSMSIRAALYSQPTLGGNVQAFLWRGITTPPGRIQITGKGFQAEVVVEEYYGCVLQLEAIS